MMEIIWQLQELKVFNIHLSEMYVELFALGLIVTASGAIFYREACKTHNLFNKVQSIAILVIGIIVFAISLLVDITPPPEYIISHYAPSGSYLLSKTDNGIRIKYEGSEYELSSYSGYKLREVVHLPVPPVETTKLIADRGPYEKIEKDGKTYLRRKADGYIVEQPKEGK